MATKSRYEAYARTMASKREAKIAKDSGVKTSVLDALKKKKEQTAKPVMA